MRLSKSLRKKERGDEDDEKGKRELSSHRGEDYGFISKVARTDAKAEMTPVK